MRKIRSTDFAKSKECYLDSSATTRKPTLLGASAKAVYTNDYASAYRGLYESSEHATTEIEATRSNIASWLKTTHQVIFTPGVTQSINTLAGMLEHTLTKGDNIVVSVLEHHANYLPWLELAKRTGAQLRTLPVDSSYQPVNSGQIDAQTKIIALTHVSNVTGTIVDIEKLIAQAPNAFSIVDGSQAIAHALAIPVCDAYVFPPHKCYGPDGLGILLASDKYMHLRPSVFGGHATTGLDHNTIVLSEGVAKFEPGTPASSSIRSFGRLLHEFEPRHESESIRTYAYEQLQKHVTIHGPKKGCACISFTVPGVPSHDVAQILANRGIAIRAGHHCAIPLHQSLGLEATCRASFGVYTTKADVKKLVSGILYAKALFGGKAK
jgi:cysteine desulfurase/selenocysteine lyase